MEKKGARWKIWIEVKEGDMEIGELRGGGRSREEKQDRKEEKDKEEEEEDVDGKVRNQSMTGVGER